MGGLTRGWYGETECWYTDPNITWFVVAIPAFLTYLSLIVNYSVIYALVRKSLKPSEEAGSRLTSKQKRLKREAGTLMMLYVISFFVIASPSIVKEILYTYFGYSAD